MKRAITFVPVVFALFIALCGLSWSTVAHAGEGGSDASAHVHATITANKETYTSGETAQVSIRYTIDHGAVSEGDYIVVTVPPDIASGAKFSASRQHFSSVEDMGEGRYKLVFGPDAATGLSGSMTVRVTTQADTTTTDRITAGDGEKAITVVGAGTGESGIGTFADEAIMKDGLGNEGMSYGGYDYSQDNATQIGIFDSTVDNEFMYRLFINRKNVSMTNVVVTDTLPDGMYFTGGPETVGCYRMDASTMSATDETVDAEISLSGQALTVSLGDIDYPVEIAYKVIVPAQTSVRLRNHSEVTYTQDGTTYQEHRDYIAQGSDYSAANGVKSVDKTVISDDPADQWVTYTITFWNDNGFDVGEISLVDKLDSHVKYLYADDSEYFDVSCSSNDPDVVHITNSKAIPTSTKVDVTFVCDFSDVPVGYTVSNTVGGNTTKTQKVGGSVQVAARKTVDGSAPGDGEVFAFQLADSEHKVLQTVQNDTKGDVTFDPIAYGKDDLGKTYTYYVSERAPQTEQLAAKYTYDTAEYTVVVRVGVQPGSDGTIPVDKTVLKGGNEVDEISFDNTKVVPYTAVGQAVISGTKAVDAGQTDDLSGFTFSLSGEGKSLVATTDEKGAFSFAPLEYSLDDMVVDGETVKEKTFVYTLDETAMPAGYTKVSDARTVLVTVTDDGSGTLETKVDEPQGGFVMENAYRAITKVVFSGKKTMDTRELREGETFRFTVVDEAGTTVADGESGDDGAIVFDEIVYQVDAEHNDVGEHVYTVTEEAVDSKGVTSSTASHTVAVVVVDNHDGTLTATPSDNFEQLDFVNAYEAKGSVTFAGTKRIDTRALEKNDVFTFEILENDKVIGTAANGPDGTIAFPQITYVLDKAGSDLGTHEYRVRESSVDANGITVDPTAYTVTVDVSDNGDGTLDVAASANHEALDFVNAYTAQGSIVFEGSKTLEGADLEGGEFSFVVKEGDEEIAVVHNDADGTIAYPQLDYTLDDIGEHTYTIAEVTGDAENIVYDETVHEVVVTVADEVRDGTLEVSATENAYALNFANVYEAPEEPQAPEDEEKGDDDTPKVSGGDTPSADSDDEDDEDEGEIESSDTDTPTSRHHTSPVQTGDAALSGVLTAVLVLIVLGGSASAGIRALRRRLSGNSR